MEAKSIAGREPTSDRRFGTTTATTDPADMPQSVYQRFRREGLLLAHIHEIARLAIGHSFRNRAVSHSRSLIARVRRMIRVQARGRHREALLAQEGEATFLRLHCYNTMVQTLTSEWRLSRKGRESEQG
jgi:hypothetical protein